MVQLVELAFDLWAFGLPVVAVVWALLRIFNSVPARLRYAITVAGVLAALAFPLAAYFMERNPLVRPAGGGRESTSVSLSETKGHLDAERVAVPLSIVWIAGTLVLLLRDGAGHLRLWQSRGAWRNAPDGLKRVLDWPGHVPLAVARYSSPLTAGFLRPRVVLPSGLAGSFPLSVVRRIALHELSHARWRDPLVCALMRGLAAVFWPAPVWPLLRWARREREAAADEAALRGTVSDQESYVAALVHFSRLAIAQRRLVPAMAGSDLEYRARRILVPAAPRVSIVAVIVMALAGIVAANVMPAEFRDTEPSIPPSVVRPSPGSAVSLVSVGRPAHRPSSRTNAADRQTSQTLPVAVPPNLPSLTPAPPAAVVTIDSIPPAQPQPTADRASLSADVDVHRDVHRDVDRHVAIDRGGGDADQRIVIRSVIVAPGDKVPSRLRSFAKAVAKTFGGRDPTPP